MFYHLLYPLRDVFFGFNVFGYISFRAVGAALSALIISFLFGPKIIRTLKSHQIGETIRSDGPESHLKKEGTPTMGGIIVLLAVILPTFLWAKLDDKHILLILLATMWMGAIGFLDDYLKVVKKYPRGLIARYKMAGQISLGLIVGIILINYPDSSQFVTSISIPFVANGTLDVGWFYIPLVILVITGTSNAVNLTDGLDGLAIVPTILVAGAFAIFAYVTGNANFAEYLNIPHIPLTSELVIVCTAMVGAGLGFLWFNTYPAQVFMGDVGSLALGGTLGVLAVLVRQELVLIIMGGVFVMETLSVILQVGSYKLRGQRIFRMAPIHHHYELKGWPEPRVIVRFWIISIILVLVGLATLKLR